MNKFFLFEIKMYFAELNFFLEDMMLCKLALFSVFFSREPQKSGREHYYKSAREYFACAREYKNEKVPVNLKIAREQPKTCP